MRRVVFEVAFDGTAYWGWQKTGSGRSVEDALERALTQLVRHPVQLEAASRLDRGVHARGQVVAFHTEDRYTPEDLAYRANCLLPPDIRVVRSHVGEVAVKSKEYRYYIDNNEQPSPFQRNFAWHVKEPLNLEVMQREAKKLLGAKDFQVFCNQRKGLRYKNYERTVTELRVEQVGDLIEIVIIGESFLYKMCRNIVGLLVGYGKGLPLLPVEELIERGERGLSYVTAPACGLFLQRVTY